MVPDIYKFFREKVPFSIGKFFFIFLLATIYSVVIYFVPFFTLQYAAQNGAGTVNSIDNIIFSLSLFTIFRSALSPQSFSFTS